MVEAIDQAPYGRTGLASADPVWRKSKSFGKVQPHIAVSSAFNFFFGQVSQDCATQSPIRQPGMQSTEKRGVGSDEVKVFQRIGAQMLRQKLACAPGLKKGMIEKIVAGNTGIKFGLKNLKIHKHTTRHD